mmetsp:Transcript_17164/g.19619  ORF Transcript_17164/g.19619 Transcript_17164/m.19619 type:complete len:95 (-) Transcript_17164:546-830(-)
MYMYMYVFLFPGGYESNFEFGRYQNKKCGVCVVWVLVIVIVRNHNHQKKKERKMLFVVVVILIDRLYMHLYSLIRFDSIVGLEDLEKSDFGFFL